MDGSLLTVWSRVLLDALARAGVRHVVSSPGSRNTPFVLAAAARSDLVVRDVIDERAAAFFALGQARITGQPSLLLCTSGTAPAHYLPAILEASHANVPLIVLSADRPSTLVGSGAPQTIDQAHMYGSAVRGSFDLGLPDARALLQLRRVGAAVVALAKGPTPGPVHLNARADKPLEPIEPEPGAIASLSQAILAAPPIRIVEPRPALAREDLDAALTLIREARRGLIVAGPAPADRRASCAVKLAVLSGQTGFPVYAEATSQLRFQALPFAKGADALELAFAVPAIERALAPDLVIEIGRPPTSGRYASHLAARGLELPRIQLASHGLLDPHGTLRVLLAAPPEVGLAALTAELPPTPDPARAPYAAEWERWGGAVHEQVTRTLASRGELAEADVVRALFDHLPAGSDLFVGNSLAVRHVDAYLPAHKKPLAVLSQRGVCGIDGILAGAAGSASVSERPLTVLLGDVSLLADLSSLALLESSGPPLVVVVIHNDGGRIFERLPIGRAARDGSLDHFVTPHGRSLAPIALALDVAAREVRGRGALARALEEAYARPGPSLIEARVGDHDAAEVEALVLAGLEALT